MTMPTIRAFHVTLGALATICALAACSGSTQASTADDTIPDWWSGVPATSIRVVSRGGIAALQHETEVQLRGPAAPRFVDRTGPICLAEPCPPARDSASGLLPQGSIDAIQRQLDATDLFALRDDYGVTPVGGDVPALTLQLHRNERFKAVAGDVTTLPREALALLEVVQREVSAARGNVFPTR